MKKNLIAVALLAALSASAVASAGEYFIGGDVGSARSSGYTGLTKNSDTAFSLVGGYQYNKNIGVEANYTDLGSLATLTSSVKTKAHGVSAVGTVGVTDSFGLYGKVGYGTARSTISFGGVASRSDFNYGLGATYTFDKNVNFRAGVTHTPVGDGVFMVKGSENVYAIGAVYKFN